MRQIVCKTSELSNGHVVTTRVGQIPVVVLRAPDGSLHALVNKCCHQGGPVGAGRLSGTTAPADDVGQYVFTREGEILRCPWHGYEYDVKTGATVFDAERRIRRFQVIVEGDDVVIYT